MTTFKNSVAILGAVLISAISFDAFAASKTLEYSITRDGSAIGSHAYTIETNGSDTNVNVTTDIKVKALFITVYKFVHESKEVWNNGLLVSLVSTTDDDGTQKTMNATAAGNKVAVESDINGQNRRQLAEKTVIPASLWNPAIVTQSTILNTVDGKLMAVKIESVGNEEVEAGGTKVSASHYKITGELTRDVWYNTDGDLVRMSFPDKTKSEIVYTLN